MSSNLATNILLYLQKTCVVMLRPIQHVRRYSAVADFLQQLTLLTATGLPLVQCIDILATQKNSNAFMEPILKHILQGVRNGKPLGAVCAQYPELFSPLMCTVFTCGERSGTLHPLLLQLSEYELRERHVQHKIRALWMCAWGGIISVAVIIALLVVELLPDIVHHYPGKQFLISLYDSGHMLGYYSLLWFLISIALIVMVFNSFKKTAAGKTTLRIYHIFSAGFRRMEPKNNVAQNNAYPVFVACKRTFVSGCNTYDRSSGWKSVLADKNA